MATEKPPTSVQEDYSMVEPDEPVPMKAIGTWAVTYVVGDRELPTGSAVHFYLRNRPPWSPMQSSDPDGPGYVHLTSPQPSVGTITTTSSNEDETYAYVRTSSLADFTIA